MTLPRIKPITPVRHYAAFDHADFLFELKHDGFRALAYLEDGKTELVSRKQIVYKSFARLAAALASLPVKDAILDGEIVCLDGNGRSMFLDLMRRRRTDAVFYCFDLLWLNGEDLRGLPLIERKNRLRRLIRASGNPAVLFADHVEREGVKFFEAVCARDLEGMVCKHRLGTYTVTAPTTWYKVLNPAYTQKRGRHELFDRLKARAAAASAGSS